MIDTAVELEKILDKINKQAVKNGDTLTKKALDKLKSDRENIKKISLDLYPDYKANIITLDEYTTLKENMASKIADLDIKIAEYEKTIETEKSAQTRFLSTKTAILQSISSLWMFMSNLSII